jgi:hypothetical protein
VIVNGANSGTALQLLGTSNAIANTATLSLAGGGAAGTPDQGYIDLGAGVNEQVGTLVLGGVTQVNGTYGGTGSSATNVLPEYFAPNTGIITVGAIGVAGDYNGDTKVNAADYVTWRKNPGPANGGDPGGYVTWRENFDTTSASSSSLNNAVSPVPEPATCFLSILGVVLIVCKRRART